MAQICSAGDNKSMGNSTHTHKFNSFFFEEFKTEFADNLLKLGEKLAFFVDKQKMAGFHFVY